MSEFDKNWQTLAGRTVELRYEGRLMRTAEVEEVSADSSLLWLRPHGNDHRQIIGQWEGYDVTVLD
ncbi:hypothetical protein [Pseudarthrobacter scleromae]|uniref:hypothetical protein n=1 Tax=Pseudarthrobacter scleromae TaxID=158897 RepID=UPI003D03843E